MTRRDDGPPPEPWSPAWNRQALALAILVVTPVIALIIVWIFVRHPVPIYWQIDRPVWRP